MDDFLVPYQIKGDYYRDVNDFAEAFIGFAGTLNLDDLSEMLEGLLIGVYWEIYKNDAVVLPNGSHDVLAALYAMRNKSKMSKDLVDDIRGMILTKEFSKKKTKNELTLNRASLKLLLDWLEATGDFAYQLPYLRKYEDSITSEKLEVFLKLAAWFLKNSPKYLATYTAEFKEYFEKNKESHKMNEDVIFFNSPEEIYHLNMLGANLMNRIFCRNFRSRKRKALLLPSCMRVSEKNCNAENTGLGPVCRLCNKNCNIYKIAKDFPHELYLIEHNSDSLKGATEKDLDELGIIGVSCVLNLISGGYQASKMGIPPQCVILNRVSCSKHWLDGDFPSTIDLEELSTKF